MLRAACYFWPGAARSAIPRLRTRLPTAGEAAKEVVREVVKGGSGTIRGACPMEIQARIRSPQSTK